jgi:hypothetical protein
MTQTMYTHVNKWIIKKETKQKKKYIMSMSENNIGKPTESCWKMMMGMGKERAIEGVNLIKVNICMCEIPQWNPFVQLIYTNKNSVKKKSVWTVERTLGPTISTAHNYFLRPNHCKIGVGRQKGTGMMKRSQRINIVPYPDSFCQTSWSTIIVNHGESIFWYSGQKKVHQQGLSPLQRWSTVLIYFSLQFQFYAHISQQIIILALKKPSI